MFSPATYAARRRDLAEQVGEGLVLLQGNDPAPMRKSPRPSMSATPRASAF
jgi:hypothetical protein